MFASKRPVEVWSNPDNICTPV